jgi:hydroxymethylglutaryl-CoA reductase
MNCNQIREQILCAENINKLQKEAMVHLQACQGCQEYQSAVHKMEKQIGQLRSVEPLFSTHARLKNIEAKLNGRKVFASPVLKFRRFEKERGRQKLSVAVALVAFLFAVVGGLMLIPKQIDRESIAGLRVYKDSSIHRAGSQEKRWQAMVKLAKEARTDAIVFAGRNDAVHLKLMADYLEELLQKDVDKLSSVRELRDQMLDFALELGRSESEFQRLASLHSSSPEVADSLVRIALASKEAELRIRRALQA